MVRGRDRGDRAALAGAHQEQIVCVNKVKLLHHADYRFQICLLGPQGHIQRGTVALAAVAAAAKVKAVDRIAFFGKRLRVGDTHPISAAEAV